MIWRLWLAALLLVSAAPAAAAPVSNPVNDAIVNMSLALAVDPAQAGRAAQANITRYTGRTDAPSRAQLAVAYWVSANAQYRQGDPLGARRTLQLAASVAPADANGQKLLAYGRLLEGVMARGDGDFGLALQRYRGAQSMFIAIHDDRGEAMSLQLLGSLYAEVGDSDNAIRYLTLAEEAYAGDDAFLMIFNNNFGIALQNGSRYSEALAYFQRALVIAERHAVDGYAVQIRINLAVSQVQLGQFSQVARTLAPIGPPNDQMNPGLRSKLQRILARQALQQGQHLHARRLIEQALSGVDPATSDPSYRKAHYDAYLIYKALGENALALGQIEAVRRIDAADAELTASNRASLIAGQFQFAAQNARIARLQAVQLQRDVQYQRTVTLITVTGSSFALILLGALLVIAIRGRNRARRDGAELAIVNQRLERALAAKTEFLASTSHELRTPLNGILGMTQIMLADSTLSDHLRAQVDLVHDAGTTMRALVDDILDVAKIEHGGFVITPRATNVADLAKRVTRLFEAQSSARGVALDLDIASLPATAIMIDPDRMTQILFNLVGNAIKFTSEGRILVRLSVDAPDSPNARLRLDVQDQGIGIAPEWQDAIFDMFRQVDGTRTRQHGGSGLGLSICRQLARAMGGDIAVESVVGQGSCFTVTLPWQPTLPTGQGLSANGADFAALPLIPADDVAIIALEPMRAAMLAAMVRHAGRDATIVDVPEQIGMLMNSSGRLCLIDHLALDHLASALANDSVTTADWVIVGEGEQEVPAMIAKTARRIAFARNAVTAVVAQAAVRSVANSENSCLHQSLAIANGDDHSQIDAKRARSMSGY